MTFYDGDLEKAIGLLSTCRKYGINFFDHAEVYGDPAGNCETLFGKALKILQMNDPILWRRSDLVITTKLFYGPQRGDIGFGYSERSKIGVNELGLSRKHVFEGMDAALNRLQLKYVDIVYCHRCDPLMDLEEIVSNFTDIIRSGRALFWGTSNWKFIDIIKAYYIAKHNPYYIAPVMEQPQYSMFCRDIVESEYLELTKPPFNIGFSNWGSLDKGLLTGKYILNQNGTINDGRLSGKNPLGGYVNHLQYTKNKEKNEKIIKLNEIAKELNVSMANLAIGWVLKNDNIKCCMLGASKSSQIEQTIKSIDAANKITKDIYDRIDKILNNKPKKSILDKDWRAEKRIISRL